MGEPNRTPWDFTKALEDAFMNVDPPHIPSTPIHDYKLPDHLPTMDELWTASVLAPPPTVHYYPQEPPHQPEEYIRKPIETPIVVSERSDANHISGAVVELESVPESLVPVVEEMSESPLIVDESAQGRDVENMGCPRCGHPDGVIVRDESGLPLGVECPTCEPIYACQECGSWDYEGHHAGCRLNV